MVNPDREERLRGALWGMFVGDALAMPAHWYYDVTALRRDFGVLNNYEDPKDYHPNSILSLSSTGGPGRGSKEGDVIGSVIFHGKKHLWGQPNRHYHHGLRSGDNTLNLLCVRVLLRTMSEAGCYYSADFLREYVTFMTTPGSHNDAYAESYHRQFFANYARGVPPERCAGTENHDTASIGGLVALPPVIVAASRDDDPSAVDAALLAHLRLTHRSAKLERYALALGKLLPSMLRETRARIVPVVCTTAQSLGFPAAKVVERVQRDQLSDIHVIGNILSPACYIDQSFPAVLYLMARYEDDFEAAVVANTNVGGDNCHRGAILGALMGAAYGLRAIPERWIRGLTCHDEIEREIDSFVAQFA